MSKQVELIKNAILETLDQVPTGVTCLGDKRRPNSWTFQLKYKDSPSQVVKVIKPRRLEEYEEKNEEEALDRLKTRTDIEAIKYLSKGKLFVSGKELQYFIFPFVEGDDLDIYLRERGAFSEDEALEFLENITDTILKLAEIGIIHQDIKPRNIKVKKNGGYILLDLGIAVFIEQDYRILKQRGPLKYLSPEQVALGQKRTSYNQRRLSFLSDLYSAAVITLELLTAANFNLLWKVDERHKVPDSIENGEIIDIKNPILKQKLIKYLQFSISNRLNYLYGTKKRDLIFLKRHKPSLPPFWNLHYSTTGQNLLLAYAKDNSLEKGGVVFLSEFIKSIENDKKRVEDLHRLEWKTIIDPSTYKLAFHKCHFSQLKHIYYGESCVKKNDFIDSNFKIAFVKKTIEYQKQFNPDFIISPYFFVDDPEDDFLRVNFDLFEETKRLYKESISDSSLLFGLAISYDLLCDEKRLRDLLDQLILYPKAHGYYIRPELIKSNNAPCSNEKYLKNLRLLASSLTISKSLLLSQVDQACLGLYAHSHLSIAINPNISIRKANIKDKLSKQGLDGGPKKEFRKVKYYVPKLLNDIDIVRELGTEDFQRSKFAESLRCKCKHCSSGIFPYIDTQENRIKRYLHFLHSFQQQINEIRMSRGKIEKLGQMINQASRLYRELGAEGIRFSEESSGKFLINWSSAFLSK